MTSEQVLTALKKRLAAWIDRCNEPHDYIVQGLDPMEIQSTVERVVEIIAELEADKSTDTADIAVSEQQKHNTIGKHLNVRDLVRLIPAGREDEVYARVEVLSLSRYQQAWTLLNKATKRQVMIEALGDINQETNTTKE